MKSEKDLIKKQGISQLRQDLVTGDWVVVSRSRANRPILEEVDPAWDMDELPTEKNCLFCDPEASGQEKDVLIYKTSQDEWTLRVFPNKYPAFARPLGRRVFHQEEGPYFMMDGVGYHELIVTRDHYENIGQMDPLLVAEVMDAYQTRYLDLMNKKSVRCIEIFHNYGKTAGASIFHPHSQLMAMPIIPHYIRLELTGAEQYHRANKKCVFCDIIEWEVEKDRRMIFENEHIVAFCPFAPRVAFEVWILPKKHLPYFERIDDEHKVSLGEALSEVTSRIGEVLGDPGYNFYLHTSPCDGRDYPHYHWHLEVLPKTSIWAGFELSTGIEVSSVLPEEAARQLRGV